jgi:hypothetical protein
MPELLGGALAENETIRAGAGNELPGEFGVLCTDYTGLVSAAKIAM